MRRHTPLTQERLKQLLTYDPETGEFKRNVRRYCNNVLGHISKYGYAVIYIDGKQYYAHRLAWLYAYGIWPKNDIDHINGVRTDNTLTNLREASRAQNIWNSKTPSTNKSGVKNVFYHKRDKCFSVGITKNGERIFGGNFATIELAEEKAELLRKKLHGPFARRK